MGNSKPLMLVYAGMKEQLLSQSVNIMLSPQFYTLKKVKLPIKYLYQAKKIAPSLFDGFLDESDEYAYMVFKEEDEWVFIAYDLKNIEDFLASKNIGLEKVSKIFFAQQSLASFLSPVLLGEKDALVTFDNTVIVIPQIAMQNKSEILTFDDSFTPKVGISPSGTNGSFLSNKQTMWLTILFTLFALMFFVEGWRYTNDSKATQEEMQKLLEEYPSLQSQYTRKSISVKYSSIDAKERKKRDRVKTVASMIFKGVKVESFSMNEKIFKVEFSCSSAKVAKRLLQFAKKSEFNSAKILTGNTVQIEEKL